MPNVFSRLAPPFISAYALQIVLALIFVPQANEKYYDLGGSAGFLTTALVSLTYGRGGLSALSSPFITFAPRQLILTAMLGLWSGRLGSFLVTRALKAGGDSRFDEVKHQPGKFAFFWMAQATWNFLVGLPVYLVNVLPKSAHPRLGPFDYAGIALFTAGLAFEVIADRQKSEWRKKRDIPFEQGGHGEKFITSGLWGISRHPNYVGEVTLWTGIYAASLGALYKSPFYPRGFWVVGAFSPIFTYLLLRKVSGVPPLEKAGDKKFGEDPKWKAYTNRTPVFWPFIGSTKA